jgi:uncharacterized membrane protein
VADTEHIETAIVVERDRAAVFARWTRFEDFPTFMKGVERVDRVAEDRLRWTADIGFVHREWEATVVEHDPDRVVAWRADGDVRHDGRVSFEELSPGRTEVTVRMAIDPQGFVETAGAKLGAVRARIAGDLQRFKELVESDRSGPHPDAS